MTECLAEETGKMNGVPGYWICKNRFFFLSTAPVEYQNYYDKNPTAERNGGVGFVGVMKRLDCHHIKRIINIACTSCSISFVYPLLNTFLNF